MYETSWHKYNIYNKVSDVITGSRPTPTGHHCASMISETLTHLLFWSLNL